ncbi:hypothetical protein JKP88DRAFT_267012 [Tribonema minus]|uniref:Uncharacterized protein n=1 Tax=Tribonema minus TaxID=303371 RepID=A0A835ZAF3_9STRA|nr:hypothetical protein JKP88DRAFT_267012 [Tribonema minus]
MHLKLALCRGHAALTLDVRHRAGANPTTVSTHYTVLLDTVPAEAPRPSVREMGQLLRRLLLKPRPFQKKLVGGLLSIGHSERLIHSTFLSAAGVGLIYLCAEEGGCTRMWRWIGQGCWTWQYMNFFELCAPIGTGARLAALAVAPDAASGSSHGNHGLPTVFRLVWAQCAGESSSSADGGSGNSSGGGGGTCEVWTHCLHLTAPAAAADEALGDARPVVEVGYAAQLLGNVPVPVLLFPHGAGSGDNAVSGSDGGNGVWITGGNGTFIVSYCFASAKLLEVHLSEKESWGVLEQSREGRALIGEGRGVEEPAEYGTSASDSSPGTICCTHQVVPLQKAAADAVERNERLLEHLRSFADSVTDNFNVSAGASLSNIKGAQKGGGNVTKRDWEGLLEGIHPLDLLYHTALHSCQVLPLSQGTTNAAAHIAQAQSIEVPRPVANGACKGHPATQPVLWPSDVRDLAAQCECAAAVEDLTDDFFVVLLGDAHPSYTYIIQPHTHSSSLSRIWNNHHPPRRRSTASPPNDKTSIGMPSPMDPRAVFLCTPPGALEVAVRALHRFAPRRLPQLLRAIARHQRFAAGVTAAAAAAEVAQAADVAAEPGEDSAGAQAAESARGAEVAAEAAAAAQSPMSALKHRGESGNAEDERSTQEPGRSRQSQAPALVPQVVPQVVPQLVHVYERALACLPPLQRDATADQRNARIALLLNAERFVEAVQLLQSEGSKAGWAGAVRVLRQLQAQASQAMQRESEVAGLVCAHVPHTRFANKQVQPPTADAMGEGETAAAADAERSRCTHQQHRAVFEALLLECVLTDAADQLDEVMACRPKGTTPAAVLRLVRETQQHSCSAGALVVTAAQSSNSAGNGNAHEHGDRSSGTSSSIGTTAGGVRAHASDDVPVRTLQRCLLALVRENGDGGKKCTAASLTGCTALPDREHTATACKRQHDSWRNQRLRVHVHGSLPGERHQVAAHRCRFPAFSIGITPFAHRSAGVMGVLLPPRALCLGTMSAASGAAAAQFSADDVACLPHKIIGPGWPRYGVRGLDWGLEAYARHQVIMECHKETLTSGSAFANWKHATDKPQCIRTRIMQQRGSMQETGTPRLGLNPGKGQSISLSRYLAAMANVGALVDVATQRWATQRWCLPTTSIEYTAAYTAPAVTAAAAATRACDKAFPVRNVFPISDVHFSAQCRRDVMQTGRHDVRLKVRAASISCTNIRGCRTMLLAGRKAPRVWQWLAQCPRSPCTESGAVMTRIVGLSDLPAPLTAPCPLKAPPCCYFAHNAAAPLPLAAVLTPVSAALAACSSLQLLAPVLQAAHNHFASVGCY